MGWRLRPLAAALVVLCLLVSPSAAQPPDGVPPGPPPGIPPDPHGGGHPGGGPPGGGAAPELQLLANLPPATDATPSGLAFWGDLAVAGSSDGFRLLDISDPADPRPYGELFACNGAPGEVSIHGHLVFRSVNTPQSSTACDSTNVTAATPGHFAGIQVFDVSDPDEPVHINSIYTDCGSRSHTLVPDDDRLLIYVTSFPLGSFATGPNCRTLEQDPVGGGHSKISIIEVDLDDPSWSGGTTVSTHPLDGDTPWATYLNDFTFRGCFEIGVFIELGLAAAACMSEAQLWDITDPLQPDLLWRFDHPVVDPGNVDAWRAATFTWDGQIVAFGDHSGGGGAARCMEPDDLQGRIWLLDTATGALLANYKVPRSLPGVCTTVTVGFVPRQNAGYTLVTSALTAGTSVVDVNRLLELQADADPTLPAPGGEAEAELAWAQATDPHPVTWAAHWYNGHIYTNDALQGVDVFRLRPGWTTAGRVDQPALNPRTQVSVIP